MFKRLTLVLSLVLLWSLGASAAVVPYAPGYTTSFEFTSSHVENDYSVLITACPSMYFEMKSTSGAVLSVYPVNATDNTAALIEANTRIVQMTEGKKYGPYTPSKSFVRIIVDRREASAIPTTVDVSCGSGTANYSQVTPSTAEVDSLSATVNTLSGPVKYGYGVGLEGTPGFVAKSYPGSSVDGSEYNNMNGFYYNKSGVYNSTIPNPFEHAYDFSFENNYRGTSQTSDVTLMEWNWDFYPADHVVTTTSSSTSGWAFLDVISFSGGGTARVFSVSGSDPTRTVTIRSDQGSYAVGETMTNITRGGTAVVATMTPDPLRLTSKLSGGNSLRAYLFTYNTLVNTSTHDFFTGYESPVTTPTLSISAGNVSINGATTTKNSVNVTTTGTASPLMHGQYEIADHATATSDVDYTLPSAVTGMNACFYDNGGGDGGIIIDAAAGDEILLDGTGVGVADAIDSPGVAGTGANGDSICLLAIDATYWITLNRTGTWVDGGVD